MRNGVGNGIPALSRSLVTVREQYRCGRCRGVGLEWHHRRSRSIRDQFTHSPCNGVWLCTTCHRWAHKNVLEARSTGYIVSRYNPTPGDTPIRIWSGWVLLTTEGTYTPTDPPADLEEPGKIITFRIPD